MSTESVMGTREKPKDSFEGVARGLQLIVKKIKEWLGSGAKPEEQDFAPVVEARNDIQKKLRDEADGMTLSVPRGMLGEAEGRISNPDIFPKLGERIISADSSGTVKEKVVGAEDVEKQRLIDRNRGYLGEEELDLSALGGEQAIKELEERKREISKALTEHPQYKDASPDERTKMLMAFTDLDEGTRKRFQRFSPDALTGTVTLETAVRNLPQGVGGLALQGSEMTEDERATLQGRWEEEVTKKAALSAQKPTEKQEIALQRAMMEKFKEVGQEITLDEAKDRLKDPNQRMATLELLVKQDQQQNAEEALFASAQGELKAMDQVLELLKRGKANPNSIFKRYGQLALKGEIEVASAREARKNGFDRVSIKSADPETPPVPPVAPPEGDGIVTPPPPVGPSGPEGVPPQREVYRPTRDLYNAARDAYLGSRRGNREGGIDQRVLAEDRNKMQWAELEYVVGQMAGAAQEVRNQTAPMEQSIQTLRDRLRVARGPEGGAPAESPEVIAALESAIVARTEEMRRAQVNALTLVGVEQHVQLDRDFHAEEMRREPTGWKAKFNRFWMSKAGSAVKAVSGIALTTAGGFTANPLLIGLGTTMAASAIGWEGGKAWGRNKIRTPEQVSRLSAEQVDQLLNSQRELERRQGRMDPEREATVLALEARRTQILEERVRERVQRLILEEGGMTPDNIATATAEALRIESNSFLRTGEATDDRAKAWEMRRRVGASLAGGAAVGLAALASQWGEAAGNLASEVATRTAMRADYNADGVWNWVRNGGTEFWDAATKTWHTTGGTGGFAGAKEIIVTLPK